MASIVVCYDGKPATTGSRVQLRVFLPVPVVPARGRRKSSHFVLKVLLEPQSRYRIVAQNVFFERNTKSKKKIERAATSIVLVLSILGDNSEHVPYIFRAITFLNLGKSPGVVPD